MNPSFSRQVIHTSRMTIAHLNMTRGGIVPDHHHENEQVTILLKGRLKFISAGVERILEAGEVMQIPPHVPHRVEALEDSECFDVFTPVREDWIRGDDAYLRHSQVETESADRA